MIDVINSHAHSGGMAKTVTDRTRTEETIEESRKLREIWDRTADDRAARGVDTQERFALAYEIGSQAMVGHCLTGYAVIPLRAALAFARGLGCFVSDFSPRLARQLYPGDPPPTDTPAGRAEEVERLMARMTEEQQREIVAAARYMVNGDLEEGALPSPSGMLLARLHDQLPEDSRRKLHGAAEVMLMAQDFPHLQHDDDDHDLLHGGSADERLPKPEPADRW